MDPNDPKGPDTLVLLLNALRHGVTAVPFERSNAARMDRCKQHEQYEQHEAHPKDAGRVHETN